MSTRPPARSPAARRHVAAVIAGAVTLGACSKSAEPPAAYPPPIPEGGSVFFVGNSFFGWGDRPLPQWVAALGAAVDPPVKIEVGSDIVFGESPLRDFLGHPATREALASGRYGVWVLQGHELEAVDHKAEFHQAVRDFNREIEATGGKTVLFMTWDFPWRSFVDEVAASYDEIGRELGIPVIPAGLVYEDCRREPFAGESHHWLTADAEHPEGDLHQNERGSAANAYATFAVLTGRDPRGTGFVAPGNTNDDAMLRYLSQKAWARVAPRLRPTGAAKADPR